MRRTLLLIFTLLVAVTIDVSVPRVRRSPPPTPPMTLVGCSAVSSLFPGIATGNTVSDLDAFIQVASSVSTWAAEAWAFVPNPEQMAALAVYTDLQNGLKTAITVAESAVAAYIATGAVPNWSAVMVAVTQAVDAIISELVSLGVNVFAGVKTGTTPPLATRLAQLQSAQKTIHSFKAPR
jgi:hypothetical protein